MKLRYFKTPSVSAILLALCLFESETSFARVVKHSLEHYDPPELPKVSSTVKEDIPQLSEEMLAKLRTQPFNNKLFKLSFKTLIFNSHIKDAYQIAFIGVTKRPNDIFWHEKLAQTAIWVGDYKRGIQEWFYIINKTKDIKNLIYVINIAKVLGYDRVLIYSLEQYLERYPDDRYAYYEIAKAQNRLELNSKAFATIKKIDSIRPLKEADELGAKIYFDEGRFEQSLNHWEKVSKIYDVSVKSAMAQAEIYYTKNNLPAALLVMKRAISVATDKDKVYWQQLAELSWILNDKPTIELAYSKVMDNFESFGRLLEYELAANPRKALNLTIQGWQKFRDPSYFYSIIALGLDLQEWQLVMSSLLNLTPTELAVVEKKDEFWLGQSSLYNMVGDEVSEKRVLLQGLRLHPKFYNLKKELLWLVISNGESLWIKSLMSEIYLHNQIDRKELWQVYAEGFGTLNKFFSALEVYQKHLEENLDDDQVFIDYAALMDKALLYQQVYDMRQFIFERTQKFLSQGFDKKAVQALAQVSPYFVSGTEQVMLMSELMQHDFNAEDVNIILNWLSPKGEYVKQDYNLIAYFKAFYLNNHLPDWAGIHLALIQNDLPALQKIMDKTDREWPRADRINAAVRLENIPLAVDLAYNELAERPTANEIFPEYTQYALSLAKFVKAGEEYEKFINVVGPRTNLSTRQRLTNKWYIHPTISIWDTTSKDLSQIINVPSTDAQAHIKLEQTIHRGSIEYSLGYRQAVSAFVPASIALNYKLSAKWTFNGKLGINQEDFQTSYLRTGGVEDQLDLEFIHNITYHDTLYIDIQGRNYYSQNRHYLGDGYNLLGLYKHNFWLEYPDYALGGYFRSYQLNRNGTFSGNVTRLFPDIRSTPQNPLTPQEIATNRGNAYVNLIPNTYNEVGVEFSFGNNTFGQDIKEYSHAWRPYLWASVFYSTITYLSNEIETGLTGSVFGRDNLLVYLERGTAPAVANSTNYVVGARYMVYF